MIFQSKSIGSKLQRVFTRSKYDHVALILRYNQSKVVIFESLTDNGVQCSDWEKFITQKWCNLYNLIIYRKLYFPRDKQMMDKIDDFVK